METIKQLEKKIKRLSTFVDEDVFRTLNSEGYETLRRLIIAGTELQTLKDVVKLIEEVKNPYPTDVFPEIHEELLEEINHELMNKFEFPLDRLSAHLMRLARNTLKEELKQKLTGFNDSGKGEGK